MWSSRAARSRSRGLGLDQARDLHELPDHRVAGRPRIAGEPDLVHHSSRHDNLSTALRQTRVPMTALPFWLPLVLLGFKPWMILLEQAIPYQNQYGVLLSQNYLIFGGHGATRSRYNDCRSPVSANPCTWTPPRPGRAAARARRA